LRVFAFDNARIDTPYDGVHDEIGARQLRLVAVQQHSPSGNASMAKEPEGRQIALAELRILQEIIARHESHEFRIKGWFAAIIGGFAAAMYLEHSSLKITLPEYLVLSLGASLAFWFVLLYHRGIVELAKRRVGVVQDALRSQIIVSYRVLGYLKVSRQADISYFLIASYVVGCYSTNNHFPLSSSDLFFYG
jgi:hypothetical protein